MIAEKRKANTKEESGENKMINLAFTIILIFSYTLILFAAIKNNTNY